MRRHYGSLATLLILCLAVTLAGTFANKLAQIIESKNSNDGLGNYEFKFRTSDGITRWQTGRVQYSGDKPYIRVEGGYSYHLKGVKHIVTFVADQNGYRPTYSEELDKVLLTPPPPVEAFPSRFGAGAVGK